MRAGMAFLAAALVASAALPASADDALTRLLSHPSAGDKAYGCFLGVSDRAPAAKARWGNVRRMVMLVSATPAGTVLREYTLRFGATLRSRKREFKSDCICYESTEDHAPKDKFACPQISGGGPMEVTIEAKGSVLISIPERTKFWDPTKTDEDQAKNGFGLGDKIFRLQRAPVAACAGQGYDDTEKALLQRLK